MIYEFKLDESGLKGVISIDVPPYEERLKLIQEMDIKTGDDGELDVQEPLEKAISAAKRVRERVKSVDVTHAESGLKIESFEDFSCFAESQLVIAKLQNLCMNGISLGNG